MIRPLTPSDIAELERVQSSALPGSLPIAFGARFFRLYNETLMDDPRFVADGFFWEARMAGFLTYSTDSAAMLAAAFQRRPVAYCAAAGLGGITRPRALRAGLRLLPGLLRPRHEPGSEVKTELISFGVLAEFRRRSEFFAQHRIHVASELLHRAFAQLHARGTRQVKIFVRREEVDPFINQFYRREGFRFAGAVRRFGAPCNHYVRDV